MIWSQLDDAEGIRGCCTSDRSSVFPWPGFLSIGGDDRQEGAVILRRVFPRLGERVVTLNCVLKQGVAGGSFEDFVR